MSKSQSYLPYLFHFQFNLKYNHRAYLFLLNNLLLSHPNICPNTISSIWQDQCPILNSKFIKYLKIKTPHLQCQVILLDEHIFSHQKRMIRNNEITLISRLQEEKQKQRMRRRLLEIIKQKWMRFRISLQYLKVSTLI